MNLPDSQQILEDPYYANIGNRLTLISVWLGGAIAVYSLIFHSVHFTASFLAGSVLSYYNFAWMKQGIDRLLEKFQPAAGVTPRQMFPAKSERRILLKYFIRYALIGATLYAILRFRILDLKAAVLGLFLFVMAVLFECIFQVGKTLVEDWKRGRA